MNKRLGVLLFLGMAGPVLAFDFNNLDMDKVASGGAKLFKAAAGISDASEIKIGREVAANLAARYGLVEDPARVRYINLVGQTVVQRCGRTSIPYHFGLLKTKEFNALAAPGGYVFITEGLLDSLQNEAELAGVLAHEVSHITQRHIVKAIRKSNMVGAGVDFASAANENAAQLAQVTDFSIHLLENGLSRQDELEADTLGTALAAKTGYAVNGLRDTLQRLADSQGKGPTLARFNKTHPPAPERIKAIDKSMQKNHLSSEGTTLAERFRKNIPKA
jgi:predicted Zn-dependent protease